jgi:hypothetical protein
VETQRVPQRVMRSPPPDVSYQARPERGQSVEGKLSHSEIIYPRLDRLEVPRRENRDVASVQASRRVAPESAGVQVTRRVAPEAASVQATRRVDRERIEARMSFEGRRMAVPAATSALASVSPRNTPTVSPLSVAAPFGPPRIPRSPLRESDVR